MFRFITVLTIVALGVAIGVFVGLVGGIAYIEFGKNSCSTAQCAGIIARAFVPVCGAVGGMLGLAKGINLTTAKIRNVPAR